MTNLLKIEGMRVKRYVKGKLVEQADIDRYMPIAHVKAQLEDFRANGLPPPEVTPGEVAFERIATELAA